MAVFTIVVQSAVAPAMMGAATSSLTFARQVGGTIGLALAGTIFGSSLTSELPGRLLATGVPQPLVDGFTRAGGGALDTGEITGVGIDLGAKILSSVPAPARPQVEPFIPNIVDGIYQAFSVAIGHAIWLGVAAAVLGAALLVFGMPQLHLRRHVGDGPAPMAE
jgi:hypothetical protein